MGTFLTGAVITVVSQMPELLASRRAALGLVDKMARTLELNVRDEEKDIPNCLENGISVHNLCFGYEPDNEILHDMNIDFKMCLMPPSVTTLPCFEISPPPMWIGQLSFRGCRGS